MKILLVKSLSVYIFTLFTCFAWSQDQIIEANLKYYNNFWEGIYSDNGFWVVGNRSALKFGKGYEWNFSVHKFSSDLSKKEWEVDIKGDHHNVGLIYNPKEPSYVYIHGEPAQGNKKFITQISPDGKAIRKETAQDKILEDDLFYFCDASFYYEVWAKKNSPDLVIVKYEHSTLEPSRLEVKMPPLPKKITTSEQWSYAGKTDSTFILLNYHIKGLEETIDIVSVNIFSGKIQQLEYTPNLSSINISPSANIRFSDGTVSAPFWSLDIATNYYGSSFKWSSYGNIILEPNGDGFYFYALGSFSDQETKEPKPEGFIITKLDKNAREVWSKQVAIKEDEVDNTFYRNPRVAGAMRMNLKHLKEDDALSMEITYNKTDVITALSSLESGFIASKIDKNGNLLDKCYKNFSEKALSTKGAEIKNNADILPCFSDEKAQKIVDFINTKGETGTYNIFRNKDSYILLMIPKEDKKSYKCIYFAN